MLNYGWRNLKKGALHVQDENDEVRVLTIVPEIIWMYGLSSKTAFHTFAPRQTSHQSRPTAVSNRWTLFGRTKADCNQIGPSRCWAWAANRRSRLVTSHSHPANATVSTTGSWSRLRRPCDLAFKLGSVTGSGMMASVKCLGLRGVADSG